MIHRTQDIARLETRRKLLKTACAVTVGVTLSRIASSAPVNDSIPKPIPYVRLGIFLAPFRGPTLESRLDGVKAAGLDYAHMGMDNAGLAPMPDVIPAEMIERIRRESAARGIEIASMQGTFNMCHPDADFRRGGVRRIGVLAAACKELGVPRIHLCTGTRNRVNMWGHHPSNGTPEAWADMAACVRDAVEIAKPFGITLAFEPEVNNVVDSAKKARQLLDEINSPLLKVTMDGSNLFHAGELPHMSEILDNAFALVGTDIAMAHAKDVSHDGDAGHEPAGHGKLDYDRYVRLLHASGMKGPLLLHGLSQEQVPECVAFVREKIAKAAAEEKAGSAPK